MLFMLFACGVGNTDSLQISCGGKQCVRGIDHDMACGGMVCAATPVQHLYRLHGWWISILPLKRSNTLP